MNAALNCVGNTTADSNPLNSSVINGSSTSAQFLRRRVGMGSAAQSAHCLSGSMWMAAITSSTPRAQNAENSQPGGAETNDGGTALAVYARTPLILGVKGGLFTAKIKSTSMPLRCGVIEGS